MDFGQYCAQCEYRFKTQSYPQCGRGLRLILRMTQHSRCQLSSEEGRRQLHAFCRLKDLCRQVDLQRLWDRCFTAAGPRL